MLILFQTNKKTNFIFNPFSKDAVNKWRLKQKLEALETENYNQMSVFVRTFYTSILRIFGMDQVYLFDPLLINIDKFIHQIEKRGLDFEGIYRVAGITSQVNILMKDFQKFSYFDVKKWDEVCVDNMHIIPNLFKGYIRDLPLMKNQFIKLLSKPSVLLKS
jgi:hypothetical protein